MESIWVSKWIERCLEKQKEAKLKHGTDQIIYFADRSPFSAVFYAKGPEGKLLEPLIQAQLKQLEELAGISIITVYVKVDPDLLYARILDRLKREPGREKFNEASREWMEKTVNFYENNQLWDHTVENNTSIDDLVDKIVAQIRITQPRFEAIEQKLSLSRSGSPAFDSAGEQRTPPQTPQRMASPLSPLGLEQ